MTLEKANELMQNHVNIGHDYNRNAANLVLFDVMHKHGQTALDQLIHKLKMTDIFVFQPGESF